MSDLKYTTDHEWIRLEGDVGVVGISIFAQEQLGDVVFVGLPEIGRKLTKGQEAATVESVKAASEIYAPLGGEVVAVNAALADDPSLVNSDPTGKGWFVKIRIADRSELDGLMDDAAYAKFVAEQG